LAATQIAHYRIIEKLGTGGMGEVFLAQDTKLERRVAIKLLPAKSLDDLHARKRLLREARAAATLDHPNICSIYEVNDAGDSPFIVMQYVEGKTLFSKLQEAPLTPEEVIDVGVQVAEALAEAHERGVIHRDIKPQNVIITPRGQAKVLDFGLARIGQTAEVDAEAKTDTQLTGEGYIVGTVAYMSPEQLKAMPIDARSDLFSLGATLYECATGKPAFTGNSKIEISSKVLQVEPRKPSHLNPGIPRRLEQIILKAMAKDADARYQSATEMLDDLRRLRSSLSSETAVFPSVTVESSGAITPPLQTPFQRAVRSRKVQIALAAIVVLLLGFVGWRWWRGSPYQPTPDARKWYDLGLQAAHDGTFWQASKRFELSVSLDDNYAPAHAHLAEAYVEINNTEKAQEELLRATPLAESRPLASADAAYLDAIAATIRRDFPAAINGYQKILDQASATDKATAYLDLGRAYERNEKIDQATDCYLNATKLNPQSPAAFLRLAMAYGRRQDSTNAENAFAQAEKLYQTLDSSEGRAEVMYQRGVMYLVGGKLKESEEQLNKVLEMLQQADSSNVNLYQLTRTQLELSLLYRDQGNLDRAKEMASKAITIAQSNGNLKNIAANGLIDLGLAFLSHGDFDNARVYFQQALDLARRDHLTASEKRSQLALGRLNFQLSNYDDAVVQLKEALDFFKTRGYPRDTSLALTLLGRSYQDMGQDDQAQIYFNEGYQLATQSNDEASIGDYHMSMTFLRGKNQEQYVEALTHLDEKLRIDQTHDMKRGIAFDQMNRGLFLNELGRYAEAKTALDAAFDLANQKEAQYKTVMAWVHLVRARMALNQRQYGEAKKNAQLAVEASEKYPDVMLQAQCTLGLTSAYSGSAPEGHKLCEDALVLANKTKSRQLITFVQLALAEILLLEKNAEQALNAAQEVLKIFAQSGQKDSEWRTLLIAARASDLAGNRSAAQDFAARADKACGELQQRWGADNYESYLRRPDIQAYRTQLAQLLKR
jgi:serine/threonine protein kinase/Tfp pilus assembly protein PilF